MKKNIKVPKKKLSILLAVLMVTTTLASCSGGGSSTSGPKVPDQASYPIAVDELGSGKVKWVEEQTADGWMKVTNEGGTTLGYSKESGVTLIQSEGYAFKDLNRNGQLDGYEDWRQDMEFRSENIASQMQIEDIAGLMLYSGHQFSVTKELSDDQKTFLDQGLRAVLSAASASSIADQAGWANSMQAYAEKSSALGIPVNISTDPRTTNISVWPGNLALSATFDTAVATETAQQLSKEFRALGIGTYLGPQVDIATEPRWWRTDGSLGEDPALARDVAEAIVSGFQSTYDAEGNDLGWGENSVNAMAKHWVAEGAAQSGREGHTAIGQFSVFPANNFDAHLVSFVDGAFNLKSVTKSATAVMSSYSIAYSEDKSLGEYVGSSFSEYKMGLLRNTYGFDGVVCTDWGVATKGGMIDTGWGVEASENPERIHLAVMAGVDQFGGNNDPAPVLEAYQIGVSENGEEATLARYQDSGRRLLKNYFYVGLFDNPYVSVENANAVVAGAEAMAAGKAAQLKTVTMLKNEGNIIAQSTATDKPTVYVPLQYTPQTVSFLGFASTNYGSVALPVPQETLEQYFNVVTDTLAPTLTGPAGPDGAPTASPADIIKATPEQLASVDYALVFMNNPDSTSSKQGYDEAAQAYVPITLQYGTYTANSDSVRKVSIVGPMVEKEVPSGYVVQKVQEPTDINYFGKEATAMNNYDLVAAQYATANVDKVIVALNAKKPTIVSEFEKDVDAILVGYGIENATFLDIVTGKAEPTALLPFQMPANMDTVEANNEDAPRDLEAYTDAAGNKYDFAFGLNWSGVINDERVAKYNVAPITAPVYAQGAAATESK